MQKWEKKKNLSKLIFYNFLGFNIVISKDLKKFEGVILPKKFELKGDKIEKLNNNFISFKKKKEKSKLSFEIEKLRKSALVMKNKAKPLSKQQYEMIKKLNLSKKVDENNEKKKKFNKKFFRIKVFQKEKELCYNWKVEGVNQTEAFK